LKRKLKEIQSIGQTIYIQIEQKIRCVPRGELFARCPQKRQRWVSRKLAVISWRWCRMTHSVKDNNM
jgi:hypothetical protein